MTALSVPAPSPLVYDFGTPSVSAPLPVYTVTPAICKPLVKLNWVVKSTSTFSKTVVVDNTQKLVTLSGAVLADAGAKTFTLTWTMVDNTKVTVADEVTKTGDQVINTTVKCNIKALVLSAAFPQSYTYVVDAAALDITLPTFVTDPPNCASGSFATASVTPGTLPTGFTKATGKLTVNGAAAGTYIFKVIETTNAGIATTTGSPVSS